MNLILEIAAGILLAQAVLVVSRKVFRRWKEQAFVNDPARREQAKEERYWEEQHIRGKEAAARLDAWLAAENAKPENKK